MTIAPCLFSLNFRSDGYWRRVSGLALTLSGCIIAAYILGVFFAAALFGFLGLAQRLFLALVFAWMILVVLHLTRAPRRMRTSVTSFARVAVGGGGRRLTRACSRRRNERHDRCPNR